MVMRTSHLVRVWIIILKHSDYEFLGYLLYLFCTVRPSGRCTLRNFSFTYRHPIDYEFHGNFIILTGSDAYPVPFRPRPDSMGSYYHWFLDSILFKKVKE